MFFCVLYPIMFCPSGKCRLIFVVFVTLSLLKNKIKDFIFHTLNTTSKKIKIYFLNI